MKLSRTAIKELTAAYRAVLKRALVASMGLVMVAPAMAAVESLTEAKSVSDGQVLDFDTKLKISSDEDGTKWDNVAITVTKGGTVNFDGGLLVTNNTLKDGAKSGILQNKMGTVNIRNGATFNGNTSSPNSEGFLRNANPFPSDKIENPETTMNIAGDLEFLNNKLHGHTLLFNMGNFVAHDGDVVFMNNELTSTGKDSYGTAIYNNGGGTAIAHLELLGNSNQFLGNIDNGVRSETQSGGAAIHNRGSINNGSLAEVIIGKEDGSSINNFIKNVAAYNGGAIVNRNYSTITFNGKTTFDGNTATKRHGGAIYNFSQEGESASMTFNDNVVFKNNFAGGNGGAIWNGTDGADDVTATITFNGKNNEFEGNLAAGEGGAIWNSGEMNIANSDFEKNGAVYGGAIYNAGTMTIDNVEFEENTVSGYGGAVMAYGRMDYTDDSDLAVLTITNSSFEENSALNETTKSALGGAVVAGRNSKVIIKNSGFEGNTADYAGAIFSFSSGINDAGEKSVGGILDISDSIFKKNTAMGAGAVQLMAEASIKNTRFIENTATTDTDGGGAVFVGAVGKVTMDNVFFRENKAESYRGGAISTRSADLANNKDARLDILNSSFLGNTAGTTGGAIDNFLYSSVQDETAVYVDNSKFISNSADKGGAIYNHGDKDKGGNTASLKISNSTFTGNKAKTNGGAIYNEKNAGITFIGNNTFASNTQGETIKGQPGRAVANDIYNLGDINIESGETTFGGGVSGMGTLTVENGATMNIGTAMIEQGVLNIDGLITASVVDSRSHGRLYADTYNIGETGKLKLNVGQVGTYGIFNKNMTGDIEINVGNAYTATKNSDGSVTIATKDLETLAADTGLSTKAAGVVAGLANSNDRSMSMLSLRVQNALDAGRVEYVEQEAGKMNPAEKPITHSVASSVQNQVMNTLANRMAALGAIGRSGGDVNAEYGFWAHGLINKSKYGSQFDGTTRGAAIGVDTLINRAFTIGAGYAYGSTDLHANDRTADIDSNTLFAYAQWQPARWYVNGALNYTKSEYTEHLSALGLSFQSEHDVTTIGGQIMTGYDFSVGLTPEVGVRYLHMSQDDYHNGLASVKGTDSNFLTGMAGMKYSFLIQDTGKAKWRPELRAAATYDFVSDDTAVTVTMPGAAPYIVDGDRLSRFGGEFGLGISVECRGLTLTLSYDLDLHEDYTSQTGMAKFKLMF